MRIRLRFWFCVSIVAGIVAFGCGQKDKKDEVAGPAELLTGEPTRVLATVNDYSITLQQVNRMVQAWRVGRFRQFDPGLTEAELQSKALDNLIDQRVLRDAAQEAGLAATDDEVNTALAGFKTRFVDEGAFQQAMQQQGVTEQEVADGYRAEMTITRFIDANFRDTLQISPEDVRQYYDTHPEDFVRPESMTASHIIVRAPTGADPAQDAAARAKSTQLLVQLRSGADFATLARQNSEDAASEKGGDLGIITRGMMVPAFDSAAFALDPGEISEVVRSPFGYHIIMAGEKRPVGTYPFENVAEQLAVQLRQMRTDDHIRAFLEERKKKVKIKKEI